MRRDTNQVTIKQGSYFSLSFNTNTPGSLFSFLCRMHSFKVLSWVGVPCKRQWPLVNSGLAEDAEGAVQENGNYRIQNQDSSTQRKFHCNNTALWTSCDLFMMLSSQPASLPFLPSRMSPALPPHPFFLKEQRTLGVIWKMGFRHKFLQRPWRAEHVQRDLVVLTLLTALANTKLAEQSWLKWQLAHTKQKLPSNSLSANEKVTFVRSF